MLNVPVGSTLMLDAAYFRLKARECREMAHLAVVPAIREQLTMFAAEFEARAKAIERPASKGEPEGV